MLLLSKRTSINQWDVPIRMHSDNKEESVFFLADCFDISRVHRDTLSVWTKSQESTEETSFKCKDLFFDMFEWETRKWHLHWSHWIETSPSVSVLTHPFLVLLWCWLTSLDLLSTILFRDHQTLKGLQRIRCYWVREGMDLKPNLFGEEKLPLEPEKRNKTIVRCWSCKRRPDG